MLLFRREDRERVASGEITVTFRLWKSAHVKAGKAYETGFGAVLVEDVRVLPAALVAEEDVPLTGCASIEQVWRLAGEHTGAPVGLDTLLHRVQFRFLGRVPPAAASQRELDRETLRVRLARLDAAHARGPWTLAVLRLIESAPRVPARLLAAELGWETPEFKAHVRKLKALGLTLSHETGYELSDAGRRYLQEGLEPGG
jgi:hypothetical protein